jgi:hypothetical protein
MRAGVQVYVEHYYFADYFYLDHPGASLTPAIPGI